MPNINVQKLLSFLVLVSLFHKITSNPNTITEQRENSSRLYDENFFSETLNETVITRAIHTNGEDFSDNELKKLFIDIFKPYDNLEGNQNFVQQTRSRRTTDVTNVTSDTGTECYSCYSNFSSNSADNCYDGANMPSKKCADAEHCYTELNPLFIKRGCMLPGRVNRTFVCKCPLCNDKPAFDTSHYDYKKVSDWEYDNARLQTPVVGVDLMCKVCETKGTNPTSDKNCRYGKNADYMVCAHNQLCYTNIDDETDFVSRGCMDKPLYNSIYYFCNNSACNDDKFINPKVKLTFRSEQIQLREEPSCKKIKKKKKDKDKEQTQASQTIPRSSFCMTLSLTCLIFVKHLMFQF